MEIFLSALAIVAVIAALNFAVALAFGRCT